MAKGQDSRENSNDDIGLTTVKQGRGKEGGSGRMSLGRKAALEKLWSGW